MTPINLTAPCGLPSDPIFEAIGRFEAVAAPYRAAMQRQVEDEKIEDHEIDPLHEAAYAELGAVYSTAPTTPAGLLAQMRVVEEWDGDQLKLDGCRGDDATRGLAAVFHHARRLLAQLPV